MAYPASVLLLQKALAVANENALAAKSIAQSAVAKLASNVTSDVVLGLVDDLRLRLSVLNTCAATPGIGPYAQEQVSDPALNIGAEFNTMTAAIQDVVAWIVTNFPKDAGGRLLSHTINADGTRVPQSFTPAQTAGLTTRLNTLIAAIS
jgi:hypothetical protein